MEASSILSKQVAHGAAARPLTYEEWVHLNCGDRVVVHRPGHAVQYGTVDDVGEDASYFWVWLDGQGRILIFDGDGSVISTHANWQDCLESAISETGDARPLGDSGTHSSR